jgi:hypothetical protein
MKNILIMMTALTFLLISCNDEETNTKLQDVKFLTGSTWSHADVQHATDGDLSGQYQNFAISFTKNSADGYEGTFIIANGGYAFSENTGKWKLNDELNKIIFDSGRELQYDVQQNTLHLEFTVEAPGGRVSGLSGQFIFDLKPL